jgi:cobalt/nickel transport system permease protein
LLGVLIAISIGTPIVTAACAAVLLATAVFAQAPLARLLLRAAIVLPFSGVLALTVWWAGDTSRALLLAASSYVSIYAVVLFSHLTPVSAWTAALASWGVPSTFILVMQFLHRYLFLISDEARRIRSAARARGGFRFDAATGAIGVLFARSWRRSETIHRAMLARGFRGRFS